MSVPDTRMMSTCEKLRVFGFTDEEMDAWFTEFGHNGRKDSLSDSWPWESNFLLRAGINRLLRE